MPIFNTRIIHSEFTLSPFSSEQMATIGDVVLSAKLSRISRAIDSTDSPAKGLVDKYARRKLIRGKQPRRDWNFRGVTMKAAKVRIATEDRVVIGFVNLPADQIVSAQRRLCEMWSDSQSDVRALNAIVKYTLETQNMIRLVRSKVA